MSSTHIAVIGAGIAGLAAARILVRAGLKVTVLEGAAQVGGKLQVSEVAGLPVDAGAEAMLVRRPEGLDLVTGLGLGDRIVHPGTTTAAVLSRGALRPLPAGQVMGVPADLTALARTRILSPAGLARVPLDLLLPGSPRGHDVPVAGYLGARLGRELVDRLVEPLLGGVYAGRVEDLSFDATMPGLAAAARARRSMIAAARSVRAAGPPNPGPVFASLPGGLGTLPAALAKAITAERPDVAGQPDQGGGPIVRTGAMVRELGRTPDGWRLTIGPTRDPETMTVDGVVIAVPAAPAARLLADAVPAASRELAQIEYASMAIVTLVYRSAAFPRLPKASGYLIPAVEQRGPAVKSAWWGGDRPVKAVTFSSVKWPDLAEPDLVVVRCSIGRFGEEYMLQRSDDELEAAARAELAGTCGVSGPPVDTRVTRWGGGLPQYTVGHADRVARIRAAVATAPLLAVAGAAYDGLGIPACVASAGAAASRVLEDLRDRGESKYGSDGADGRDDRETQGA